MARSLDVFQMIARSMHAVWKFLCVCGGGGGETEIVFFLGGGSLTSSWSSYFLMGLLSGWGPLSLGRVTQNVTHLWVRTRSFCGKI